MKIKIFIVSIRSLAPGYGRKCPNPEPDSVPDHKIIFSFNRFRNYAQVKYNFRAHYWMYYIEFFFLFKHKHGFGFRTKKTMLSFFLNKNSVANLWLLVSNFYVSELEFTLILQGLCEIFVSSMLKTWSSLLNKAGIGKSRGPTLYLAVGREHAWSISATLHSRLEFPIAKMEGIS
jgi:hypothetical protein